MTAALPARVHVERGEVVWNRRVGPGIRRLGIALPRIARAIRPGQFVNLVPGAAWDPLLPRPFSLFRTQGRIVELLVQEVGRGTRQLGSLVPGDPLEAFGPLGRGFDPPRGKSVTHLMVAGGIGVAPFWALGKALPSGRKTLLYGAATPAHLVCLPDFRRACDRVATITVQGGSRRGFVTALLAEALAEAQGPVQVYACGPTPMLKAVWRMSLERAIPCQLSLETPMACGMGLCKGCSFPKRGAEGYTLTCREGPVYEACAIDFDRAGAGAH